MAIKHTPTGIVQVGNKGGKTGCGVNTQVEADHWVNISEKITCAKNGCN